MCTTDALQGFRKMTNFPTVALAVSRSNTLVEGKAYDAPAGWHWATPAEVEAVPGWSIKARTPSLCNYHGQGGWNGYNWQGVHRARFALRLAQAPTADRTRFVSVVGLEGLVSVGSPFDDRFAGIVCIQD
jgi:hypothetical protein